MGIYRLSSIINRLRKAHHLIETVLVTETWHGEKTEYGIYVYHGYAGTSLPTFTQKQLREIN
jgi:glycerol dehydrogenase-like iron-containing ADH family enzyme